MLLRRNRGHKQRFLFAVPQYTDTVETNSKIVPVRPGFLVGKHHDYFFLIFVVTWCEPADLLTLEADTTPS